ncbi:MAG: universal stress protein [Bacteroidota bacterium]|nr:universal stress protein [Bacteroidota bacterium]
MDNLDSILVPIDFSDQSLSALRFAAALACEFNSKLILIHCITSEDDHAGLSMEEFKQRRVDQLNEWAYPFKRSSYSEEKQESCLVQIDCYVSQGKVLEEIINTSKEHSVSLIIMGRGAHGSIEKIIGTISSAVILKAACPVLLISKFDRPPDKFQNILYASDTFSVTKPYLAIALKLGKWLKSKLHFVHVKEGEDENERLPEKIVDVLFVDNAPVVPFTIKTVAGDSVFDELEKYIQEHQIDLIILVPGQQNVFDTLIGKGISQHFSNSSNVPSLFLK